MTTQTGWHPQQGRWWSVGAHPRTWQVFFDAPPVYRKSSENVTASAPLGGGRHTFETKACQCRPNLVGRQPDGSSGPRTPWSAPCRPVGFKLTRCIIRRSGRRANLVSGVLTSPCTMAFGLDWPPVLSLESDLAALPPATGNRRSYLISHWW